MTAFDPATASTDSVQLELVLTPLVQPDYTPDQSLPDRFAAFHAANPHVADALEVLAGRWLANHDHVGIGALYEALRWESGIRTTGDEYRLNNSYRAFYARLLIERRPEWADAFRLREQRAA